jgi:hypothetical protein
MPAVVTTDAVFAREENHEYQVQNNITAYVKHNRSTGNRTKASNAKTIYGR